MFKYFHLQLLETRTSPASKSSLDHALESNEVDRSGFAIRLET